MTKVKNTNNQQSVTEFDVDGYGTIKLANFAEPETRSEFYESVADFWSESTAGLVDAMDECEPLAWAVQSIYDGIREEVQSDLDGISGDSGTLKKKSAALKARIKRMSEEPEEGAEAWLLSLTTSEFQVLVKPQIEEWFDSPPDWSWEDDYLPREGTSQGAALEFFNCMNGEDLDAIGVVIVEGHPPGSTYYAAELTVDIEAANKAAANTGIPVRFKRI